MEGETHTKPGIYSGVLSDDGIIREMHQGNVLIHPFKQENLSTSSYDVTLGEHIYRESKPNKTVSHLYNPYDLDHIRALWKYDQAIKVKDLSLEIKDYIGSTTGIGEEDKVVLLSPGETILAHTNEFIGGRNYITTMMKARSSLGRNFIEVCKCAGWGDIGYTNRWTMEITNNSRYFTIPLVVGRRIAQIVFFQTDRDPSLNKPQYQDGGKYQSSNDLTHLLKIWHHSMMLPKLNVDRDIGGKFL